MHLARNNTRPCDARFDAACAEPSITRAKNVQTRFASVAVATILLRSMEADVWLLVAVFIAATSIVLFAAWTRITMPSLRLQFLGLFRLRGRSAWHRDDYLAARENLYPAMRDTRRRGWTIPVRNRTWLSSMRCRSLTNLLVRACGFSCLSSCTEG